jgi:hypothetical protein
MIVTLNQPLQDFGYDFPAGKQLEVSVKFYRILVESGHVDAHPDDEKYKKAAKPKKAAAPAVDPEPENTPE